jgi:hypothetical protein
MPSRASIGAKVPPSGAIKTAKSNTRNPPLQSKAKTIQINDFVNSNSELAFDNQTSYTARTGINDYINFMENANLD